MAASKRGRFGVGLALATIAGALFSLIALSSAHAANEFIELTPESENNLVGTQQCVTANVTQFGFGPGVSGITVRFRVSEIPLSTPLITDSDTTGSDGKAEFCYTGPSSERHDTITAFADVNANGLHDGSEPEDIAEMHWITHHIAMSPTSAERLFNAEHCVTATLTAAAASAAVDGVDIVFQTKTETPQSGTSVPLVGFLPPVTETTDADGDATMCYSGPNDRRTDIITAFADHNGSGDRTWDEPHRSATNRWVSGQLEVTPQSSETLFNRERCFTVTLSAPTQGIESPASVEDVDIVFEIRTETPQIGTSVPLVGFLPPVTETTDADGDATMCYTGPNDRRADTITAFADHGREGFWRMQKPQIVMFNRWVGGRLEVTPSFAELPVNTEHCTTATLSAPTQGIEASASVEGVDIVFKVRTWQGTTPILVASATEVTDTDGETTFCYDGPPFARNDLVSAFVDHDGDGNQDNNESEGSSFIVWQGPAQNSPPQVGPITAPVDPLPIGASIAASAGFTDADSGQTHTATWDWGDGTQSAGTVVEPTSGADGSVTGNHVYGAPGVYTVTLEVSDSVANDSSLFRFVVIYDPSAGFVTGGGWIETPAGSYPSDPGALGRANFGFASRIKKGATTPSGSTEFQFKTGRLNFHSSSYQWLVVSGSTAKYKGTGTINGQGGYAFLVSAVDGGQSGVDSFRIKIWDPDTDSVIFDNQSGDDTTDASTAIDGGSIVVHK